MTMLREHYYSQYGGIDHKKLFQVSRSERLTAMIAEQGKEAVIASISPYIVSVLDMVNIGQKNGMLGVHITANLMLMGLEYHLSIQDILIFINEMMLGKYGKTYGQLNLVNFMEMFDKYLDDRHDAMMAIREEQHAQHKAMGPTERSSDANTDFITIQRGAMAEHERFLNAVKWNKENSEKKEE